MYLASISSDLKIHDYEHWKLRFNFGNHDSLLRNVEWSDDGKYLLQVNPAGRVEILTLTENEVRSIQYVPNEDSCAAAFHRGGHRQVAVGCRTGQTFIWDTKLKSVIKSFPSAPSPVKLLDFNCKNNFLAAALENGDTLVYGITTNNQVNQIKVPSSKNISALAFHNEFRSLLCVASDEGCILLRDLGFGKDRMFLKDAHNSVVSGLVFSPVNKDVLVSCGYDKKMHMYDTRLQSVVSTIHTDCALTCVDMNTESFVALGNKKGEILIYDLRNFKKPFKTFCDHKTVVKRVSFQPAIAKNKRFLALDSSLKETCSLKPSTPQQIVLNKTSESVKSFEFIDQLSSPVVETPSPNTDKRDGTNISRDSFLANIIGDSSHSGIGKNYESPPIELIKLKSSSIFNGAKMKMISRSIAENTEGGPGCITSASTPITGKVINIDNASPSPISRGISKNTFDINDNPTYPKHQSVSVKKFGDFVDSISGVETVKCAPNAVTDLSKELKDCIKYSMHDILEECRNSYLDMTIAQTKNRLCFEDQISVLSQKMQGLQQTQNVLIEENRKLLIEIEMLRSARK